jgi:hypothetical protein
VGATDVFGVILDMLPYGIFADASVILLDLLSARQCNDHQRTELRLKCVRFLARRRHDDEHGATLAVQSATRLLYRLVYPLEVLQCFSFDATSCEPCMSSLTDKSPHYL